MTITLWRCAKCNALVDFPIYASNTACFEAYADEDFLCPCCYSEAIFPEECETNEGTEDD